MKGGRVVSAEAPDEAFRPYRHLAIRVLLSALRDAAGDGGSIANRDSARAFLSDSNMFQHWCRVAALDPQSLAAHVGKLTSAKHRLLDDRLQRVQP
jgi:hypothetical protein